MRSQFYYDFQYMTQNLLCIIFFSNKTFYNTKRERERREIESVIRKINNTPNKEISGLRGFIDEYWQVFKRRIKLIPILYKLFQKIEKKVTLPDSFAEASIIVLPKPQTSWEKKAADQYL